MLCEHTGFCRGIAKKKRLYLEVEARLSKQGSVKARHILQSVSVLTSVRFEEKTFQNQLLQNGTRKRKDVPHELLTCWSLLYPSSVSGGGVRGTAVPSLGDGSVQPNIASVKI